MKSKAAEPLIVQVGRLYTTQETAEYLRIQRETLEVWRCAGRYPALRSIKVGGKVVYRGEDIIKFLDSHHEPAQPYNPKAPRPKLVKSKSIKSSTRKRVAR